MRTLILLTMFGIVSSSYGSMNEWYSIKESLLNKAKKYAKIDGVGSGYCGRGVYSVLRKIGYGDKVESRNGQDWEENLRNAGWFPIPCEEPENAPNGSILVYLSDVRVFGRNKTGTKGGRFGHVEIVSEKNGKKVFISDSVREKSGGTVPHNFTKRAWIPRDVYLEGMGVAMIDSQDRLRENLIKQSGFLK